MIKRFIADHLCFVLNGCVLKRNMLIALVVGSVLSFANQYDIILRGHISAPLAIKLCFNYSIPFIVSTVSAAINRPGY